MLYDSSPVILLVDGNAGERKAMARTLSSRGFFIREADAGECALAEFERYRGRIVLAIIEMIMPGMTGLDLAAELERRQPGFPILYISALPESIAMESIARRSPDRVLLKPFSDANFGSRVDKLLDPPAERREMHTN